MNASLQLLGPWSAPLGWLALEAAVVVLAALAAQPLLRAAAARRSLWRAVLVTLGLLLAAEFTGASSQLPAQLRLAWANAFPQPVPPQLPVPSSPELPFTPPPVFPLAPTGGEDRGEGAALALESLTPLNPLTLPPAPAPTLTPAPPTWPAWLWLTGLAALLTRSAWTHLGFAWLRLRHFLPAAEALRQRVQALAERLGLRRRVRVLASERLRAPAAFGWLRPGVGVPGDFTARFAPAQQDVMLAHELAHLAARDPLWQLLADLVTAALWWHPLAWVARRQHRMAGELAADDASLALPDGPVVLAECLLALGHEAAAAPRAALGMAGFRSQLGRRVERLLALPRRDWQTPSRARLALQTAAALLALAALALLPGCAANRSAGEAPSRIVAQWWQAKSKTLENQPRGATLLMQAKPQPKPVVLQGRVRFNGTSPPDLTTTQRMLDLATTRLKEAEQARRQKAASLENAGIEYKRLLESLTDPDLSIPERNQRKQAAELKLRDMQHTESSIFLSDQALRSLTQERSRLRAQAAFGSRSHRISPDGGLADVLVYVKEGLEGRNFAAPTSPHVIRIQRCEYQPYITAVQAGQVIRWESDIDLNFHPTPTNRANREFNRVLTPDRPVEATFTAPEFFLRTKDDVHPWLFGYVSVLPHPFFAVTDAEGRFRFPQPLPPGKYTLAAVHRQAGESIQELDLTQPLPAGQPPEIQFVLSTKGFASYVVSVGDELRVEVYKRDDLRTQMKVTPSGRIVLPLIGTVQVAGKTLAEVRDAIRKAYEPAHLETAHVTVTTVQLSQPLAPPPLLSTPKQAADFAPSKPPTLEELVERKLRVEAEIKEAEKLYKPSHPKLHGLLRQLETVKQALKETPPAPQTLQSVQRRLAELAAIEDKLKKLALTPGERLALYASAGGFEPGTGESSVVRPRDGGAVVPSIESWQELERMKQQLERTVKEQSQIYRPSHPKMQTLSKQLEALKRRQDEEVRAASAKFDFLKRTLQQQERELLEKQGAAISPTSAATNALDISVGRQLLVDDFLIESNSLERTWHQPVFSALPQLTIASTGALRSDFPFCEAARYDTASQEFRLRFAFRNATTDYHSTSGTNWTASAYTTNQAPALRERPSWASTDYESHHVSLQRILSRTNQPSASGLVLAMGWRGVPASVSPEKVFIPAPKPADGSQWSELHPLTNGFLVVGRNLYFYFGGRVQRAGETHASAAVGLATLRRDGFASLDAGPEGGVMTTKPVTFTGKFMFVNIKTNAPDGELRIEVLDANGNPLERFSRANCIPMAADQTLMGVSWRSQYSATNDLSAFAGLAGQPVRFRFHLRNASLYSFWVGPGQLGRSMGRVAGGGPHFTNDVDTIGNRSYQSFPRTNAAPAPKPAAKPAPALEQDFGKTILRLFEEKRPWAGVTNTSAGLSALENQITVTVAAEVARLRAEFTALRAQAPDDLERLSKHLDAVNQSIAHLLRAISTSALEADKRHLKAMKELRDEMELIVKIKEIDRAIPRIPGKSAPAEKRAAVLQEIDEVQARFNAAQRELAAAQRNGPPADVARWTKESAALDARYKAATAELARLDTESKYLSVTPKALKLVRYDPSVNPGDSLRLTVAEDDSYSAIYPVKRDGNITVKGVGRVPVGGRGLSDAQAAVKAVLEATQLPQATVTLELIRDTTGTNTVASPTNDSRVIYLTGEFITPGPLKFAADEPLTLTNALRRSGGLTPNGDLTRVKLLRITNGQGAVEEVNVAAILAGTRPATNRALLPGDIIMVPAFAPVVKRVGGNNQPAPVAADVRRLTSPKSPDATPPTSITSQRLVTSSPTAEQAAQEETLRRQERTALVTKLLGEAEQFRKIKSWTNAVGRYEEALDHAKLLGGVAAMEKQYRDALAGLTHCRIQLAVELQEKYEFKAAAAEVDKIFAFAPNSAAAEQFKRFNEQVEAAHKGRLASSPANTRKAELIDERAKVMGLVRDGKLYYEAGQYQEARKRLEEAIALDPVNETAFFYLRLLMESQFELESKIREKTYAERVVEVAQKQNEAPRVQNGLPVPNPYFRTNSEAPFLTHSSKGAQRINRKLEEIVLPEVHFDGVPLAEVVKRLSDDAQKFDPEPDPKKKGLNFLINDVVRPGPLLDATGNPVPVAQPVALSEGLIRIGTPLKNLTLRHALDVICKNAEQPTQFSVEEYAIAFIPRGDATYFSRMFRVSPGAFIQGLQGVVANPVLGVNNTGNAQGGQTQGQPAAGTTTGPVRATVPATQRTAAEANALVRQFFQSAGVTSLGVTNGSTRVFFNPENGLLVARGTTNDLRLIEQAIQRVQPPVSK